MSKIYLTMELDEDKINSCVDDLDDSLEDDLECNDLPKVDAIKIFVMERLIKELKERINY